MTTRLLVTGPRSVPDVQAVISQLTLTVKEIGGHVTLVHGACPTGVDAVADRWGRQNTALLDVEAHPAQNHPTQDFGPWPWAGPKRNRYMVSLGAARCLAFLLPCAKDACKNRVPHTTHGTASCASFAASAGIPVTKVWLQGTEL